ncbi:MAG: histidine phosphatase family protein [Cyclobacteriaceae bacterium]
MILKKIYLIRHGQTGYNKMGIVQGRGIDTTLSELGHKQSHAFFKAYKEVPFDKVYTSALQRTHQTVKPFLDLGIEWKILPGLDEISWGISEGMTYEDENNKQYYKIINSWKSGNVTEKIEGGESPIDVMERQKEAIDYILSDNGQTVLVCMHGRALRILLAWITGRHLKEQDAFAHDNLSLYVLNYDGEKLEIEKHDDRAHLQVI